jgi:hypothetical protein
MALDFHLGEVRQGRQARREEPRRSGSPPPEVPERLAVVCMAEHRVAGHAAR